MSWSGKLRETDYTNSVGPILVISYPESWSGKLSGTVSLISVGPKHYEGKQRVYIAISVGPIAHLGKTKTLRREIERLQSHLCETEIPIGETDLPRVCGSGYDI